MWFHHDVVDDGEHSDAAAILIGRRKSRSGRVVGQFVEPTIFTDVDNSMRIA
jgi:aldehyde dehydrogenase (NAD+)